MQSKSSTTESHNDNAFGVDSDKLFRTSKKPLKYRGVFPVGKRFRVVMQLDGVRHNLGMHATELEAARAYDKFARENNKKTNFMYPPKQGPPRQEPTTLVGHTSNLTAAGGLSNDKEEQTANSAHSSGSQNGFVVGNSGNSWFGDANTTIGDSLHAQFDQTQQPLTGPASYGNEDSSESCLSQPYAGPYQWMNERSQSQDLFWQQPYLQQQQQQQIMYQQQLHDPYLTQAHAAQDSHLIVYIPVPLPISEAVTKYVNDFHRFEQQQRLQQQQLSQPLHPHSNQMPANTFHPAPIFKEQNKPLSHFPALLPAPAQVQALVPPIDTQEPSLQHPEQTASSTTPAPSMPEA